MGSCIASAFRNSVPALTAASLVVTGLFVTGLFVTKASAQDSAPVAASPVAASQAERIQSLERQLQQQNRALRDYGGLIRYGSDNSELPPPAKGEDRAIFFGDQITDFWGRRTGQFFPGKPQGQTQGQTWLNRGIAGQTTDQMLIRFRQDVISLSPKVVVILAGLNDIAGLHGASTEEMILDNLVSMTELARANGIRVVLASLTPVCNCFGKNAARERWQERIVEANELIETYCAKSGATYLDYYSAMSHEGELKKELTSDGVLPNEAGYAVMTLLAEKTIREATRK
jgi:lysophospholipase L1-like esterase